MDWNELGWKCKQQKKAIDFLTILCAALVILIIILSATAAKVRYTTIADMAAEAATHTYWRDNNNSRTRQLGLSLESLDEKYAALEEELAALQGGQE